MTIKQSEVLTKREKRWSSKHMCIEGGKAHILYLILLHLCVYTKITCTFIADSLSQILLTWTTILDLV